MSHPAAILRYLHDCYRADNREQGVLDLFASKVEYRRFVEGGGDLLTGVLDRLPVVDPDLRQVAKTAALQRTEKALELGALFIVGSVVDSVVGRVVGSVAESATEETRIRLCAPLVSFPLTLDEHDGERDGAVSLVPDLERPRFNIPLLGLLAGAVADAGERGDRLDELVERLPEPPWDRERCGILAEVLASLPGLETTDLLTYPELVEGSVVERHRRSRARPRGALDARCLPAVAVMSTKRPIDSRGVLTELDRLAEAADHVPSGAGPERPVGGLSAPLRQLLDPTAARRDPEPPGLLLRLGLVARRDPPVVTGRVPAVLSAAQRKILEVAARHPLSLVIGPPGTGKSFTIACLTLDALQRGESVLVVSKMNHAVDVVADKVDGLVGGSGLVVRGGRRQYKRELVNRLQNIVAGILPFDPRTPAEWKRLVVALEACDARIEALARSLRRRAAAEERWGGRLLRARQAPKTLDRWLGRLGSLRRPPRRPRYWQLMEAYQSALEQRIGLAAELLRLGLGRRISGALHHDRSSLTRLLAALRSRTAARRRSQFEGVRRETLFSAFPVWMVSLSELGSVVPLIAELFDVVIVDEASQCDLASAVPALQRARRGVIVGDPNQLRHLSFLARRQQQSFGLRHGLDETTLRRFDYREKSLLDGVSDLLPSQEGVILLDEHFRSAPQIIGFSNTAIYGNRLRVMRERPTPVRARDGGAPLRLRRVAGERDASGANPAEAEAVLADLAAMVEAEADQPAVMRHSLGVVSPFRGQVELLGRLVGERFDARVIERHALRIGTPYAFQGEERDAIFLSLTLDPSSHSAAFRFAQRPDLFNVAITRARSLQWVYTSLTATEVPGHGLLGRFLGYLEEMAAAGGDAAPRPGEVKAHGDPFSREVAAALEARGCRIWSRWPVAGFVVDLVVERGTGCLGIDLVGYPGELSGAFRLERYRVFARAGLRIVPLPYSVWLEDRASCLAAVEEALGL